MAVGSMRTMFSCIGILLGLSLTLLVRAQQQHSTAMTESRVVVDDRTTQLIAARQEIEQLRQEIARLKQTESEHRLLGEAHSLLAAAGRLAVSGPGVVLTLSPDPDVVSGQFALEDLIVTLNELRAIGAEAIAINGQRVTPRFSVKRGPAHTLLLEGRPAPDQVRIEAVGDPELLMNSLTMRGGPVERLRLWLEVEITTADELEIPPVGR